MALNRFYLQEYIDTSFSPWDSTGEQYVYPDDNFIVSESSTNSRKCLFSDNPWMMYDRQTSLKASALLHFEAPPKLKRNSAIILKQQKSILLSLDRHAYSSPGNPLSISTLRKYTHTLGEVALYSSLKDVTLFDTLSSSKHVNSIYQNIDTTSRKNQFKILIDKLSRLPFRYVGFIPAKIDTSAGVRLPAWREHAQTELIPTSVYLQMISSYKEIIQGYLKNQDQLKKLILKCCHTYNYGRKQRGSKGKYVPFEAAIASENLEDYCALHSITTTLKLSKHISLIQYCAIMLIYIFTGMRRSEAYSLNTASLIKTEKNGIIEKRQLAGFTTKLHGRRKNVSWITSKDIEAPFAAACDIAKLIVASSSLDVDDNHLVFISGAYMPISPAVINEENNPLNEPTLGNFEPRHFQHLLPGLTITEPDIQELESVDPHRVWRADIRFSSGQEWPLAIHQIRRSTAVYAIRSGMVSLPALKELLKHITIQMSKYYSKGASFAKDFLSLDKGEQKPFIYDYRANEDFVRAWQYTNEFLLSDEPLHGPHGIWLERHGKPAIAKIRYAELLSATLKRIERGQLSYRPTPLGGCTSNEICEKRIAVNILGCNNCKSAAIRVPNLIRVIASQEITVKSCAPESPEFFIERQELNDLHSLATELGVAV